MAGKTGTTAKNEKPAKKKRSPRSPNYPSLNLETAVAKLPEAFKHMNRHPVGVEVAVKALGLSYTSSTGKLALATMRGFGLLEKTAKGMVKLSQRGLDIATDYPSDSAGWWKAVKEAALSPKVHQELWSRYKEALPADDEIRRVLIRELKFGDVAVGPLIAEYKATIDFAKLGSSDKIPDRTGEDDQEDQEDDGMTEILDPAKPTDKLAKPQPPAAGLKDFPLYTSGPKGALYAPSKMSKADFELFKRQLESCLLVIEATSVVPD